MNISWILSAISFSSVAQVCPTLCNPINCSMPGFSVLNALPEFAQTVFIELVMPSNHFILFFSLCPQSFPASGSFPKSQLFASGGQSIRASASASVLPVNIQGWYPLGLTGLFSLLFKGLSEVFSTPFKSINSSVLSLLNGPTLTSIHDYWKNHSFDYLDLCQQSDVSAS